ncbi:hypothetical protein HPP92_001049 [Vanilla planifolia]|uniref:Thioesterase domain-containing protein n=1 Tax=Vanilla planifolia TaxID=51239 RepID=A0A835VJB4_VANPL|nr:hypothetical protein HPP92_001049 [Vanilla planifolia]
MGAYIASGFQRVAGVQLSTNHIRAALLGDRVLVEAVPIHKGRTIQVWEVQLLKIVPSASGDNKTMLLSTSRITLLSNLPSSMDVKSFEDTVKKYAKL